MSDTGDIQNKKYSDIIDNHGCQAVELHCKLPNETVWIRKQKRQDFSAVSKDEILEKIQMAENDQACHGRADLFQRNWLMTEGKANRDSTSARFSVLQFNILAEGLSCGPKATPPFKTDLPQTYGGFDAVKHPDICFDFQLRKYRLLQAILDADADIIGLQEIDRFDDFFFPAMQKFGYDGLFVPKKNAPTIKLGYYSDGCALFFRPSVFTLKDQKSYYYNAGNQVCLIARLEHRVTKQHITVAVTHLKAKQSEKNEEMRSKQVDELLKELLITTPGSNLLEPIIVLGDFNSDPFNESVKKMRGSLRSAYNLEDEKIVTTWKTRGKDSVRRIIDYIFYSSALQLEGSLSIPFEEIEKEKLPSLRYPSDHILLSAQFTLPAKECPMKRKRELP